MREVEWDAMVELVGVAEAVLAPEVVVLVMPTVAQAKNEKINGGVGGIGGNGGLHGGNGQPGGNTNGSRTFGTCGNNGDGAANSTVNVTVIRW
jgi:hypothetical protein